MAKQLVNPIERHIEKGILAVTGILLIGTIAAYWVTSPNQLELGGESVSPGTIDEKIASKADSVREVLMGSRVDVESPEALLPVFEEQLDPFRRTELPVTLPAAVAIGPEVPIIDKPQAAPGQAALVNVVPMGDPAVTFGRSTFVFQTPDSPVYSLGNWVTVSAVFNVKEQMAEQQREYGATRKEVIFGPVQLQRRQRRVDGNWSDEDWMDVEPSPARKAPAVPLIRLVEEDGQVVTPREDRAAIEKLIDELRAPRLQLDLLRPFMHEIENGDDWSFPILTSYRDVLEQDDQYLHPNNPPSPDPVDRYGVVEPQQRTIGADERTPEQLAADHFKRFEQFMKTARENRSDDDARLAYNEVFEVFVDKEAIARDRGRAKRLMDEAEQLENDIIRQKRRPGLRGPKPVQAETSEEDETERQPLPTQQVWVHDAKRGSVESGKTYQYRFRPSIYNRLAGQPEKFRDKRNAETVFIPGHWSEPVEVTIPQDTLFFVTYKDKRKKEVGIEFYKWYEGVWVKSRRFKYTVGDRLQGKSRAKVPSLDGSKEYDNAEVEFEADRTVVDIDFDRVYRERRKGSGRTGVKFAASTTACSVVFMDSAGRLYERFLPSDKSNPAKKEVAKKVWNPK